ncbi:MAG TPA: hypothetical protein PKD05_17380, partial [Candidatus Melainabacteria bacterium]|nr:hypothetical protein [Candidatus Melainabacteria bacterium]
MLIFRSDFFLILAMFCFGGAALRLYWGEQKQIVDFAQGARAQADALTEYRLGTGVYEGGHQSHAAPHPEMLDEHGNLLEAEHIPLTSGMGDAVENIGQEQFSAENFFNVELENGRPLSELEKAKSRKSRKQYASADDMQLEDPQSHPRQHPFQNSRNIQPRQSQDVESLS